MDIYSTHVCVWLISR